MIVEFIFWVIVAVFTGSCAACLMIGYHLGRQDRDLNPPPAPHALVWPEEDTDLEDDKFAAQLSAWLDEDASAEFARERLASTGELAVLRDQTAWIKDRADEFIESLGGEAA
jgi:hypothetical protein